MLLLATVVIIFVHQDWWNWNDVNPRVFGFLPIGLAYHLGYAIVCAALMFCFVHFLWPRDLEDSEQQDGKNR